MIRTGRMLAAATAVAVAVGVPATFTLATGIPASAATTSSTGLADHLVVSPVYTNAVAGQTIGYTVGVAAADGTFLEDVSTLATVTLGGVVCPRAVCTATTVGEQILTATYQGLTAGGAVMVQAGMPDHLVVTPHVNLYWNDARSATFTAEAVDVAGNPLEDVTSQSVFGISPDGSCTDNSCTPATGGPHTVTATVPFFTGSVTLDASAPVPLIPPTLSPGQVGTPYSASVLSRPEGATLTQLVYGATPPPGLTLGTDGLLSGTPTTAGTFSMRIDSTNANGVDEADTTITIALPPPTPAAPPQASVSSGLAQEGNAGLTPITLTVQLDHASTAPVTVSWHTTDGSAVAGSDYVAARGTVTIPAGQLTATIPLSVIGDTVKEKNEKFAVVLKNPKNATLGTAKGTVTIANDD